MEISAVNIYSSGSPVVQHLCVCVYIHTDAHELNTKVANMFNIANEQISKPFLYWEESDLEKTEVIPREAGLQ